MDVLNAAIISNEYFNNNIKTIFNEWIKDPCFMQTEEELKAETIADEYFEYIEDIIEDNNEEEIFENYKTIISFLEITDIAPDYIDQIELWMKDPSLPFSLVKHLA